MGQHLPARRPSGPPTAGQDRSRRSCRTRCLDISRVRIRGTPFFTGEPATPRTSSVFGGERLRQYIVSTHSVPSIFIFLSIGYVLSAVGTHFEDLRAARNRIEARRCDRGTEDILKILSPIWTTKTETAKRVQGRIENVMDFAAAHRYRRGRSQVPRSPEPGPVAWSPGQAATKAVTAEGDHAPPGDAVFRGSRPDGRTVAQRWRVSPGATIPDLDRHPHQSGTTSALVGNRPGGCYLGCSSVEDESQARTSGAVIRYISALDRSIGPAVGGWAAPPAARTGRTRK